MGDMLPAFFSYVFVTVFTPGPNNVSSASFGITCGYRKTLRYILGIATGFTVIMFLCGLLTETVVRLFPPVESVLRIVGSLYMLYLAFIILRASSHGGEESDRSLATFFRGMVLQLVNPKVVIFGITVFSGFLVDIANTGLHLFAASLFLASLSFLSTSLWALFGSVLRRYFAHRTFTLVFNSIMALLLVYSAAVISGLL